MMPRENIPPKILFLLAVVALSLLPSKLETKESVASYNPQRMLRQFNFDQGSVMIKGKVSFSSIQDSGSKFINEGRNKMLNTLALWVLFWDLGIDMVAIFVRVLLDVARTVDRVARIVEEFLANLIESFVHILRKWLFSKDFCCSHETCLFTRFIILPDPFLFGQLD